jgi:hypothetical protein
VLLTGRNTGKDSVTSGHGIIEMDTDTPAAMSEQNVRHPNGMKMSENVEHAE